MKTIFSSVTAFLLIFSLATCSKSDDTPPNPNVTFLATMNGASEVPANASAFTGSATLIFNTTTKIFTITVTHNVTTPTAGHVHGPAAAGVNAAVLFPFTPPPVSPVNYTSAALTAAQEADLNANLYYVNIHTAAFPGGEIRGQLIKQ